MVFCGFGTPSVLHDQLLGQIILASSKIRFALILFIKGFIENFFFSDGIFGCSFSALAGSILRVKIPSGLNLFVTDTTTVFQRKVGPGPKHSTQIKTLTMNVEMSLFSITLHLPLPTPPPPDLLTDTAHAHSCGSSTVWRGLLYRTPTPCSTWQGQWHRTSREPPGHHLSTTCPRS